MRKGRNDIDIRDAYFPELISGRGKTLKTILDEHPEIEHGCLIYAWASSYHARLWPWGDCADVSHTLINTEYSIIIGDREDLYKHAENYGCWDGKDFMIFGNVLYSVHVEDDMQCSANDGYIHDLDEGVELDWLDIIYIYYDPETETRFYIIPSGSTEPGWWQMKEAGL